MPIYLDNAATSFPKPECVYSAVDDYQRNNGRPIARGATSSAQRLQHIIDQCRKRAADVLGVASPQQVVFTFNCTDSLNQALLGTLQAGDHVITSIAEHNSVLRPLRFLEQSRQVSITTVDCDEFGLISIDSIRDAVTTATKMIVVQHVSNVTGVIQPIEEVAEIARKKKLLLTIDAAQSAGHIPLSIGQWDAAFVACAGHKGLLGPLGTGLLFVAESQFELLNPLRRGGTGSRSELDVQPTTMPDRFESGNQNAPGLVGLEAALGYLQDQDVAAIQSHETALAEYLIDGLRSIPDLQIHRAENTDRYTGVVSISSLQYTSDELAAILDEHFQIETRAGLHCAPGIHRRINTIDRQGTVRFSVGYHNTLAEIEQTVDALRQICGVS